MHTQDDELSWQGVHSEYNRYSVREKEQRVRDREAVIYRVYVKCVCEGLCIYSERENPFARQPRRETFHY